MKIILDNGHGIDTLGKRSPVWTDGTQLFEWEFNRIIAAGIFKKLQKLNISSVLLVPEFKDISLRERVDRVNKLASEEKCFLISIHANAGGGSGWEVYYPDNCQFSKKSGEYFFKLVERHLPEFKLRGAKVGNFQLLREVNCPALLTENLFMDTWEDCSFLLSKFGKMKIISIHVAAIKKILGYSL